MSNGETSVCTKNPVVSVTGRRNSQGEAEPDVPQKFPVVFKASGGNKTSYIGRRMRNVVPFFSSVSNQIFPPCFLTTVAYANVNP